MKTKSLMASFAVLSLAVAHPAAAATRSYESLPAQGAAVPAAAERVGSIGAEADELRGRSAFLPIGIVLALFIALILITNSDGDSPG